MTDIKDLRRILNGFKRVAMVGLSDDWSRPSNFAAKYLLDHGFEVIPVNPKYPEILGQKCYSDLRDIPQPVDIVDLFQPGAGNPVRIEFFGDEVESIREFDAGSQRSLEPLGYAVAPPPRVARSRISVEAPARAASMAAAPPGARESSPSHATGRTSELESGTG